MAIEFPCPSCRQQVRTPDSAAGKKGKCPGCGSIVQIPAAASAGPAASPARAAAPGQAAPAQQSPSKPAAPAAPPGAGNIEFACPTCQHVVRTPASAAGKKGKCPHCQAIVQIPLRSQKGLGGVPKPKPAAATTQSGGTATPQPIAKSAAANPQRPASASSAAARPAAKPTRPVPASAPDDDIPTLAPLGASAAAPADPLDGLTPLDGLEPLDGLTPLDDLKPLDDGYQLTPLPAAPLQPAFPAGFKDPLAALPAANPLGIPAKPQASPFSSGVNPYTSSGSGYSPYGKPDMDDRSREGLPWEFEMSAGTFLSTTSLILGSPSQAFRQMHRAGGVGTPMSYVVCGMVVGQLAWTLYLYIGILIVAVAAGGAEDIASLIVEGGVGLVQNLIGAVSSAAVGTFITAGIYHASLAAFRGANGNYEVTYRVCSFGYGATAVLNVIPIVGPIIGFFYAFGVVILGLSAAHQTGAGRSAAAVLVPFVLLFVCCCVLPMMFIAPVIMQNLPPDFWEQLQQGMEEADQMEDPPFITGALMLILR